jgi:predicted metal-dependent phosphoesterase TrpH
MKAGDCMKIKISAFSAEGNWYKGNLHTHTNIIDGFASSEQVAGIYRDAGYDFLAITDHNLFRTYPELTDNKFLILYGAELTPGFNFDLQDKSFKEAIASLKDGFLTTGSIPLDKMQKLNVIELAEGLLKDYKIPHVVAISRSVDHSSWEIDASGFRNIQSMIDYANEHDCLAIVAHPAWSKLDTEDLLTLKNFTAIEVYNHTCEKQFPWGYASVYWDCMLNHGMKAYANACDDMHNAEFACGGYIMLKADKLSYEAVIQAIEEGNYYSSTGPEIYEFNINNGIAQIKCSEASEIRFMPDTIFGCNYVDKEGVMTTCEHQLMGNEKYLRVEVIDRHGKRAWTNPVFLD